jgi:hypothetical protein
MRHCHRELFHAQWEILLDDEFLEAYENGVLFACSDGVIRRFYPRVFTYSADYPEKSVCDLLFLGHFLILEFRVRLSSIRQNGKRACPRCLIPKSQFPEVGTEADLRRRALLIRKDSNTRSNIQAARSLIYKDNYAVNSTYVEDILKKESLVPSLESHCHSSTVRLTDHLHVSECLFSAFGSFWF